MGWNFNMKAAPKDARLLLLLVKDDDSGESNHPTEDAKLWRTIGSNNDDNVGEGEGVGWQFAGWCWSHDHFTEGRGEVVGWQDWPVPLLQGRALTMAILAEQPLPIK